MAGPRRQAVSILPQQAAPRRPADQRSKYVLGRMLRDLLLGWHDIAGKSGQPGALLAGANHIADAAFLQAVWGYGQVFTVRQFP